MSPTQRHALVFGGSGQIGAALLQGLQADGWRIDALSRREQASSASLSWHHGSFAQMPALPEAVDVIISTGPLDLFAQWYAGSRIQCPRVIAFGSTSLETKRESADDDERELADRLERAERQVFEIARLRGAAATLLRPTLVYGAGRDRTLSRIVEMARRRGFFVLPRDAVGLRQPVHVADLADAAVAVIDVPATFGQRYALPGGETLGYSDMVARTLRGVRPAPRLFVVPVPMFRCALALARAAGTMKGLSDAAVTRMREDLVFDITPARRDFGYAPRAFQPWVGNR